MSRLRDQAPGARTRGEPEGLAKATAADDDVEGHSLLRGGEGVAARRGADLGEGVARRSAIPDEGDDVEGHSLLRGGEGVARRVGPGEGLMRQE